jgi:hypothetical protein
MQNGWLLYPRLLPFLQGKRMRPFVAAEISICEIIPYEFSRRKFLLSDPYPGQFKRRISNVEGRIHHSIFGILRFNALHNYLLRRDLHSSSVGYT